MNNKNIKIVELPASVLSQISGGAEPEPKADNETTKKAAETFQTPAFWVVWDWD